MRIAIACLALMLMAGPVMACRMDATPFEDRVKGEDTLFLGQVVELSANEVTFKVISSYGNPKPGEVIRLPRPAYAEDCNRLQDYKLNDFWIHAARENAGFTTLTTADIGKDEGEDFNKLIDRIINRTLFRNTNSQNIKSEPPEDGTYSANTPCSDSAETKNEDVTYRLNLRQNNPLTVMYRVAIEAGTCASTRACTLTENAALYANNAIIFTPPNQTACQITIRQTIEGVRVQESDRTACAAALNCHLPNGFNTTHYLQKVD